jgi:hypothetical protein
LFSLQKPNRFRQFSLVKNCTKESFYVSQTFR